MIKFKWNIEDTLKRTAFQVVDSTTLLVGTSVTWEGV
jgi:hypothetical protein